MHRLINILYSGFIVGLGLGTVFQLAFLPLLGMRYHEDWTGLLWWGFAISLGTGVVVVSEPCRDHVQPLFSIRTWSVPTCLA